jgi:ABC-type sugar transport system substrate-binding protein
VSAVGGIVLDSTALCAFVSGRPYVASVVWHAVDQGVVLVVPAASLADAQARLVPADLEVIEVLLDLPVTVVVDLTRGQARQVAAVLAKAGKPDAAGQAVWAARDRGMPVVTSDPALLRALAADINIDELPQPEARGPQCLAG